MLLQAVMIIDLFPWSNLVVDDVIDDSLGIEPFVLLVWILDVLHPNT